MKLISRISFAFLACAVLTACGSNSGQTRQAPDPAPLVQGQKLKDTTVLGAAKDIDKSSDGTPQEDQVKMFTDKIRLAVAANPAEDVANMLKEYQTVVEGLSAENKKLKEDLVDARGWTDKVITLGGYALAALFTVGGVATFFLKAQLPFLGNTIGYALLASGATMFGLMQAYQFTKNHPYIVGIVLLLLTVAVTAAYINHRHEKEPNKA
jgi:hypothetical protein